MTKLPYDQAGATRQVSTAMVYAQAGKTKVLLVNPPSGTGQADITKAPMYIHEGGGFFHEDDEYKPLFFQFIEDHNAIYMSAPGAAFKTLRHPTLSTAGTLIKVWEHGHTYHIYGAPDYKILKIRHLHKNEWLDPAKDQDKIKALIQEANKKLLDGNKLTEANFL